MKSLSKQTLESNVQYIFEDFYVKRRSVHWPLPNSECRLLQSQRLSTFQLNIGQHSHKNLKLKWLIDEFLCLQKDKWKQGHNRTDRGTF